MQFRAIVLCVLLTTAAIPTSTPLIGDPERQTAVVDGHVPWALEVGPRRPLNHDDYDAWRSLRDALISPDGHWVAYREVPQDGDGELVVRSVSGSTEYRTPRGASAQFTHDSTRLVFLIEPLAAEVKQAEKEELKESNGPKHSLGILDLSDGTVVAVQAVKSFRLPKEGSGWLAYLREAPSLEEGTLSAETERTKEPKGTRHETAGELEHELGESEKKEYGTALVVRSLADATELELPWVLDYRFTNDATLLASDSYRNGRHGRFVTGGLANGSYW